MGAEAILRRAEAVDEQVLRVLVDEFFKYFGEKCSREIGQRSLIVGFLHLGSTLVLADRL